MHVELSSDSTSIGTATTSPTLASTPAATALSGEASDMPVRLATVLSEDNGLGGLATLPPLGEPEEQPSAPAPAVPSSGRSEPQGVGEGAVGGGPGGDEGAGTASGRDGSVLTNGGDTRLLSHAGAGEVGSAHGERSPVDEERLGRSTGRRMVSKSGRRGREGVGGSEAAAAARDGRPAGVSKEGGGVGAGGSGFGASNRRARIRSGLSHDAISRGKLHRREEDSGQESGFWSDDAVAASAGEAGTEDRERGELTAGTREHGRAGRGGKPRGSVPGLMPLRSPMRGDVSRQQESRRLSSDFVAETGDDSGVPKEEQRSEEKSRSRRLWASLMAMASSTSELDDVGGAGSQAVVSEIDVDGSKDAERQDSQGRVSPISLNSPMAQFMVSVSVPERGSKRECLS